MATRLYAVGNLDSAITPAYAAWVTSAASARRDMALTQTAVSDVNANISITSGANNNSAAFMLISPTLDVGQTITGTVTIMTRGNELATADNIGQRWRVVKVVSQDGTVLRGTLLALAAHSVTTEIGTVRAGYPAANAAALSSVDAQPGDRIVVELGYGLVGAGSTPLYDFEIGGTGTDHANAEGDATGTVPWVEFSQNITFGTPVFPAGSGWFTSPLAEFPFAESMAPWELRPFQPPIPMEVWTTPTVSADQSISLDDTAAAADALTLAAAVPLSDTAAASDALTVTTAVPLSDTAAGDDVLTSTAAVPLADTAAADDQLVAAAIGELGAWFLSPFAELPFDAPAPWEGGLNKGVVVLDIWTNTATATEQSISLADTAAAADALTLAAAVPLTETAAGTDFLAVGNASPLADTASAADALTLAAAAPLADTAAGADALALAVTLTLADTAAAADALTAGVPIAQDDTASAADVLAVAVASPLADTAAAADALTVAAALTLSDTATAAETFAAGVPITQADTASAVDSLTITVTIPLAETATASDSLTVSAAIALAETAAAADVMARTITVSLEDLASAADSLALAAVVALSETASAADEVTLSGFGIQGSAYSPPHLTVGSAYSHGVGVLLYPDGTLFPSDTLYPGGGSIIGSIT